MSVIERRNRGKGNKQPVGNINPPFQVCWMMGLEEHVFLIDMSTVSTFTFTSVRKQGNKFDGETLFCEPVEGRNFQFDTCDLCGGLIVHTQFPEPSLIKLFAFMFINPLRLGNVCLLITRQRLVQLIAAIASYWRHAVA
jgi:hypothetical protein